MCHFPVPSQGPSRGGARYSIGIVGVLKGSDSVMNQQKNSGQLQYLHTALSFYAPLPLIDEVFDLEADHLEHAAPLSIEVGFCTAI